MSRIQKHRRRFSADLRACGSKTSDCDDGDGCFQSEMRLYPKKGIVSVVMVNSTVFKSTRFLNRLDAAFMDQR